MLILSYFNKKNSTRSRTNGVCQKSNAARGRVRLSVRRGERNGDFWVSGTTGTRTQEPKPGLPGILTVWVTKPPLTAYLSSAVFVYLYRYLLRTRLTSHPFLGSKFASIADRLADTVSILVLSYCTDIKPTHVLLARFALCFVLVTAVV